MRLRRYLFALLLCFGLATAGSVAAQTVETVERSLGAARQQLDAIQKALVDETPDDRLVTLRNHANELHDRAEALVHELTPQLAKVEARLAELGTAPPTGEGADVAEQRAVLGKQQTQLDAQLKLARLISLESGQASERVLELRRSRFQARLFERADSIFGAEFWREFSLGAPRDLRRAKTLLAALVNASLATPPGVWLALVLAAAVVLLLFVRARSMLLRISSTRVPAGRLRRSGFALVNTLLPTLAAFVTSVLLCLGPGWAAAPPPQVESLLGLLVAAAVLATFIASLGYALLSPRRPSWRLPALSDRYAARMRREPLLLGLIIGGSLLFERGAGLLNFSLAGTVTVNAAFTILLALFAIRFLLRSRALRREAQARADGSPGSLPLSWWFAMLLGVIWTLVLASLVCVLTGYVALGSFIIKQLVWCAVVACSAYLLTTLVDDAFMALLGNGVDPGSFDGRTDEGDALARLRSQAAVLLSGGSRLVIGMTAAVLILAPFGEGPTELLTRAGKAGAGVAIGEIQIRPGLVIEAMLILVIGFFLVRLMQRWLADRYLPTTRIDPGMRTSMTKLLGYVGMIAVVSISLSAVGLGLERIAWVASALSVGIGFGLQAVVSNFVSGLILLAERPVKVGDWVSLGGVEGDIRRINVRATEIQMSDRSTVIVPNSEFITKTVRNLTMANPLGLVSIKLPMPLDTDVDKVRELLLAAFDDHPDVLQTPPPSVYLDGIESGNLVVAANGSVSSPRKSYAVRSALLFDMLRRLREARMGVGKAPTMVLQPPVVPPAG